MSIFIEFPPSNNAGNESYNTLASQQVRHFGNKNCTTVATLINNLQNVRSCHSWLSWRFRMPQVLGLPEAAAAPTRPSNIINIQSNPMW